MQVRAPAAHVGSDEQELLGDLDDVDPGGQEQQGHHPGRGGQETQDQGWVETELRKFKIYPTSKNCLKECIQNQKKSLIYNNMAFSRSGRSQGLLYKHLRRY